MKNPQRPDQISATEVLATEQGRERVVRAALNITQNSSIAPGPYERQLLDQFVHGKLTIDEVLLQLEKVEEPFVDRP